MLGFVHDFIDIDRNRFDFDAALGRDLSRGPGNHFEKKWNDGRKQLKKQVKEIQDAITSILNSFEKTDQDAVAHLDAGDAR
ncbi:hypothetical protein [Streptomyces althioticus]|uniref:hypothetical protein n=1 Tax=Streptomyces althioticus TaxID=83380 RepID=UPI00368DCD17